MSKNEGVNDWKLKVPKLSVGPKGQIFVDALGKCGLI